MPTAPFDYDWSANKDSDFDMPDPNDDSSYDDPTYNQEMTDSEYTDE